MTLREHETDPNENPASSRLGRGIVGGLVGSLIGAIAAVNVEIYSGASQGYETAPREFFEEHPVAALIALAFLVGGAILGAWVGFRRSR